MSSRVDQRPPPGTERVYFNEPVLLELAPNARGIMEVAKDYSYNEMKDFTAVCKAEGFDERAVVAGRPEMWKLRSPYHWGIVLNLSMMKPYNEPYRPIVVKWLNGSETRHWPEELWLIHRAVSSDDLDRLAEAQK